MGTDMRMYAEVKRGDSWHLIGDLEDNYLCFPEENPYGYPLKPVEIYSPSKHYGLFAILADIRNENDRDFRLEKFESISPPRGLPDEMSPEMRDWVTACECAEEDAPSWLYLSEVLQFDWYGKIMHHEANVDPRASYLFHPDRPFPGDNWPEDVPRLRASDAWGEVEGVKVQWADTYAKYISVDFFEIMNGLTQYGEPSSIRLTFWFT
jgi:hypothetical protein